MKRFSIFLFSGLMLLFFMTDSYAAKKRISLNLKIRINPIKHTVKKRRVTLRLKEEGATGWLYNKTLRLKVRKYRGKYNYSKKIRLNLYPTLGKTVKAEAFVILSDGRELYKEWDIRINRRTNTYYSSLLMSKFRGKSSKKPEVKKADDNAPIKVNLSVNGKIKTMSDKEKCPQQIKKKERQYCSG